MQHRHPTVPKSPRPSCRTLHSFIRCVCFEAFTLVKKTAPRPRVRLPRVLPSAATAQVNGVEASVGAGEAGPVDSDGHLSASAGSSDESSSSAGSDNDDDGVGGSVAWTPRPLAVPIVAPRSRAEAAASSRAQSEGRAASGPPPSPPLRQVRSDHPDIQADPEHPFPGLPAGSQPRFLDPVDAQPHITRESKKMSPRTSGMH